MSSSHARINSAFTAADTDYTTVADYINEKIENFSNKSKEVMGEISHALKIDFVEPFWGATFLGTCTAGFGRLIQADQCFRFMARSMAPSPEVTAICLARPMPPLVIASAVTIGILGFYASVRGINARRKREELELQREETSQRVSRSF